MSTQVCATPSTPDTKGKGKDKEVDASSHTSDVHTDAEEDPWGQFPLEVFPSPPADGFCHERQANPTPPIDPSVKFNPPLDPPLMALTFPPPPHLAKDPKWYANMFSEVHRHRDHLNSQLDRAQSEAVAALAEVTLAQIELSAEFDQMQNFINRVASVAGHKFARKLLSSVQCEDAADDESEEERQDADDEDSSGDDHDAGEEHQSDAKNNNPTPSGDEGDEKGLDDENLGGGADAEARGTPEPGSLEPIQEEEEDARTDFSPQKDQQNADDVTSRGYDDVRSWGSPQPSSPAPRDSSRKRLREEDDEATSSANSSPRKKFKGKQSSPESSPVWPRRYTHPDSDDENAPATQHVWSPEDDEVDPEPNSDEEYEVEDSLFLEESQPVTPPLAGPSMPRSLLEISRDPRRLRQNSRGEPELYIPGRR